MITLENRIADEIVEQGDGDEYRREQLVESYAENITNELMDDIGLKTDESFAILLPAITKAIKKEIDWDAVDKDLNERHQDAMDWFRDFEGVQHA